MNGAALRAGAAIAIAAAALSGCETPMAPAEIPAGELIEGQWYACLNDGAGDYSKSVTFFPDASYLVVTRTYGTSDATCGGPETSLEREGWNYELGRDTAAVLGPDGTEVAAREMTTWNREVVYTIVYVDHTVSPPRLYFGDLAFDPLQDGTTPEKRPDVLAAATPLTGE